MAERFMIPVPDYLFAAYPTSMQAYHSFLVCHRVRDLTEPKKPSLWAQCYDCNATLWAPIETGIPHEVMWVCEQCVPVDVEDAHAA